MASYSLEQKLDFILDALRKEPSHHVWHIDDIGEIGSKAREIRSLASDRLEFDYLLSRLHKDCMIQIDTTPRTPVVKLLYKGYFFEGYVKQKENLDFERNQAKTIANITLAMTIILAFGTVALALIELLK